MIEELIFSNFDVNNSFYCQLDVEIQLLSLIMYVSFSRRLFCMPVDNTHPQNLTLSWKIDDKDDFAISTSSNPLLFN